MAVLTGLGLKKFVISVIGTPYVYGAKYADGPLTQNKVNFLAKSYPKMFTSKYLGKIRDKELIGKICTDCSGLITAYTGKLMGSAQMYSHASARVPYSDYRKMPIGTILWRNGHVGVFCGQNSKGQYYCVEAKGIDSGTVASICDESCKWKYGLLFNNIEYNIIDPGIRKLMEAVKSKNPYSVPSITVKRGSKGDIVKWLQWELIEAGYGESFTYQYQTFDGVKIDGRFGAVTEAALLAFQQSCKIEADAKCGPITREQLILDKGE